MNQKDKMNQNGKPEQGDSLQDFVFQQRRAFDHRLPDPAIKERILSQLQEGKEHGKAKEPGKAKIHSLPEVMPATKTPRRLRFWSVAASVAALLVLGVVASLLVGRNNGGVIPVEIEIVGNEASQQDNVPVPEGPIQNEAFQNEAFQNEVVKIEPGKEEPLREMQYNFINSKSEPNKVLVETKESRILALLEPEEPASKRMEALLEMASMPELTSTMMAKIKHTINHDPNSNVRSTAIGLLLGSLPMEEHSQAIQEVFVLQDDPSIQLELMMAMANHDTIQINNSTADRLMAITENPLAFDFVKEQAYAVLLKTW